jgi:hypothetical protein
MLLTKKVALEGVHVSIIGPSSIGTYNRHWVSFTLANLKSSLKL